LLAFDLLEVVGVVGDNGVAGGEAHADAFIQGEGDLYTGQHLEQSLKDADREDDAEHDQILLPQTEGEPIDGAEEEGQDAGVDQDALVEGQGTQGLPVGFAAWAAVLVVEGEALLPFGFEVALAGLGLRDAFHGTSCLGYPYGGSGSGLFQPCRGEEGHQHRGETPEGRANGWNGAQHEEADYRRGNGGNYGDLLVGCDAELVVALFAFPGPAGLGWAHDGGGKGVDGSGAVGALHIDILILIY